MKKTLAMLLSVCMILALLAGCGAGKETPAATTTTAPADSENPFAGMTLTVANWQAYNSDEDYCEKAFEDMYGCNVEHVYYNSYEDLLTTLLTGGAETIDAVVISNNYTEHFRREGLLATIDTSKLTNYEDIVPAYKDMKPYAVDDEGVFGVPWCFGVTALVYNADKISFDIDSWTDLLNPELEGHICMGQNFDGPVMVAAMISGQDPTDMANLDLAKVEEVLTQLRPQMLAFTSSQDEQLIAFRSGEMYVGSMWTSTSDILRNEGYNIKVANPIEGTIAYADFWHIVEGSAEAELAYKWIDWIISEEQQYTAATGLGSDYVPEGANLALYCPINQKTTDRLTDEQLDYLGMASQPHRLVMVPYLTPEEKDGMISIYETFKANAGR